MIVVTGGAGFIGSNFIHQWLLHEDEGVVNLDSLTYSGNLLNLKRVEENSRYVFVHADIGDRQAVGSLLKEHRPRAIVHFAAETHVDRSIHSPESFVETNVLATQRLFDEVLSYWRGLRSKEQAAFRFLHVSTDEVFGSLGPDDPPFHIDSRYAPNSPYSASKAASDHLARAYHHTYGLPIITSHCTNNYGPYQFPEKLIPLVTVNALGSKSIPLYGDGLQERNWIYVTDHCDALRLMLNRAGPGSVYLVGDNQSHSNLKIVETICDTLNTLVPREDGESYAVLIRHVRDRPGHDRRYDVDSTQAQRDLGWRPQYGLEGGLEKTVQWYLDNSEWVEAIASGEYQQWMSIHYSKHFN